jgi:hypothetical protein
MWLLTLTAFFAFHSCAALKSNNKDKPCFLVANATYEPWVAGVYQGGSGTEFRFTLLAKCKTTVSFDSVWVNNTRLKATAAYNKKGAAENVKVVLGDTILRRSSIVNNKNTTIETIPPPIPLKNNQAVIRLKANGKSRLLKIEDMKKVTGIPRP